MGGFINNVGSSQAAGQADGGAGASFESILSQIAAGVTDMMNGGQGAKAQGDNMSKLENILSQLKDILAGLKGDEGAGEGVEGASQGAGCEHSGKGQEAGGAQGASQGGQAEQSDPISQLKDLVKQLQDSGILSKEQADKIMAQLDEMQAKQEAGGAEGAEQAGGGEQAEGAQGSEKADAASAEHSCEEAKAGDKAGEENSIIQQLEELISQLKDKIDEAKAKESGEGCGCPEAENAGSFMDDAGQSDYANMLESNKAA